jgi:hypothetical protein
MKLNKAFLVVALCTLVFAAPAMAHDQSGSTEEQTVTRSCGAASDPHYTAPGPNDCRRADGSFDPSMTYQSTYYSNNVRCGDRNQVTPAPANATGIRVYGGGSPTSQSGYLSVCTDGSGTAPNPVQGRATLAGGAAEGAALTVDGDKDNGHATAQGWIKIEKGLNANAPTYRCGDEHSQGGRADSDHPDARDTSGECAN